MAAREIGEGGGFWSGLLVGVLLASLALLGLALAYPPASSVPPLIPPEASSGPDAPLAPDLGPTPEASLANPVDPVARGPLIGDAGRSEAALPTLVPIAPRPEAPNSPSLSPLGETGGVGATNP